MLVGYFVLGPSDLFKLVKEVGKFIQNIRTLGTEATKTFESTMENQLELTELRKAQTELNSAFNFRRSINVDQESEAFTELPPIAETGAAAAAAAGTTAVAAATSEDSTNKRKKKKRRRVKKKKVEELPFPEEAVPPYSGDIPDLDMTSAFQDEFKEQMGATGPQPEEAEAEMAARLRRERLERLEKAQARAESAQKKENPTEDSDWFSASESDIASEILAQQPSPEEAEAANDRFANQLNGKWNDNILENEEQLSPLAKIMDQLSILEDERAATTLRLDVEFAKREQIEEKFYRQKRELLEMGAAEVSAAAYNDFDFTDNAITNTADSGTPPKPPNDKEEVAKDAAPAVNEKTDSNTSDSATPSEATKDKEDVAKDTATAAGGKKD